MAAGKSKANRALLRVAERIRSRLLRDRVTRSVTQRFSLRLVWAPLLSGCEHGRNNRGSRLRGTRLWPPIDNRNALRLIVVSILMVFLGLLRLTVPVSRPESNRVIWP